MKAIVNDTTMIEAVREYGFIPFFAGRIPHFSVEELTPKEYWFDGEEDTLGPWDWKIACVQAGDIAYGKFLWNGKAAFATVEWYRELMNWKRARSKPNPAGEMILDYLEKHGSVSIREVRGLLGVKKSAADAAVSRLMSQCRVLTGDIARVYRGPNLSYKGWQLSSFCTPEALFSEDQSGFAAFPGFPMENGGDPLHTDNSPEESRDLLVDHILELFPGTDRSLALRCIE